MSFPGLLCITACVGDAQLIIVCITRNCVFGIEDGKLGLCISLESICKYVCVHVHADEF